MKTYSNWTEISLFVVFPCDMHRLVKLKMTLRRIILVCFVKLLQFPLRAVGTITYWNFQANSVNQKNCSRWVRGIGYKILEMYAALEYAMISIGTYMSLNNNRWIKQHLFGMDSYQLGERRVLAQQLPTNSLSPVKTSNIHKRNCS